MYRCGRCKSTFDKESKLKQHMHVQKIPCDFFCDGCGNYYANRKTFQYHKDAGKCRPTIIPDEDDVRDFTSKSTTNINQNVTITGDNNQSVHNNISNFYQNFNITIQPSSKKKRFNGSFVKKFGISPHDSEFQEIDFHNPKMSWLGTLLIEFIKEHEEKNIEYTSDSLRELVLTIASYMYCNPDLPENINIMDKDQSSKHNQVYDGKEFVKDLLPKAMRNEKVVQKILYMLTAYNSYRYIITVVKEFNIQVFIPYIIKCYSGGGYYDSFQELWRYNVDLYDSMTKEIPHIPEYQCSEKLDFNKQFLEFGRNRKEIFQKSLSSIYDEHREELKELKALLH